MILKPTGDAGHGVDFPFVDEFEDSPCCDRGLTRPLG